MISLLAQALILGGALLLVWALVAVRRLIDRLPLGMVRNRWYLMTVLIVLFLAGYLGYAWVFRDNHSKLLDIIVPVVFFFGACFVLLTANLSLLTAMDVMRISSLERQAFSDPLTGLFNRRYLDSRLTQEVTGSRRYGLPLSVLMLDIDHFKQINDWHGHQVGDQVLVSVGKIVAEELRKSDVLVRYGGEEFLVITPNTPHLGAAVVAERARKRIESHKFKFPNQSNVIRVTVSIGVASLGDGISTVEQLINVADKNLYRAKHGGRNQVVTGTPTPDSAGG